MPFDPHLAKGGIIDTVHELKKKSRLAAFRNHRGTGRQICSRCRAGGAVTSPHKVAFPARCAVNISYEKHLCSQVFPAGIPVEGFFEGMVELFDADLKRKGFDGVALPAGSYELHKINGVRLDINKSLDELGRSRRRHTGAGAQGGRRVVRTAVRVAVDGIGGHGQVAGPRRRGSDVCAGDAADGRPHGDRDHRNGGRGGGGPDAAGTRHSPTA